MKRQEGNIREQTGRKGKRTEGKEKQRREGEMIKLFKHLALSNCCDTN